MSIKSHLKFNWLVAIVILATLVGPVLSVAPVAANTSYQLHAFGVMLNPGGTAVTDIGWARGNSDKGWREGDWIPCRATIVVDQGQYPLLAGFPNINIGFDFTAGNQSNDPRFIDLVRDIQIGTTLLDDAHGWPKPDGSPYDTGPSPLPALVDVRTAQTSPGENQWTGYTLLSSLNGTNAWDPLTQVNVDYSGGSGLPSTEKHQFIITGNQVRDIFNSNLGVTTFYVYFQFHLARTFVWQHGIESGYDAPPTDDWGGWLYGEAPYTTPPVDMRNGSGYAPGSSGHMYFNIQGVGQNTTQLPVPPQPTGSISGAKWLDINGDHFMDNNEPGIAGWDIHIWYKTPDGILFEAHATTDATGNYTITDLTPGIWYLAEHANLADTIGWSQTYPYDLAVDVLPGGHPVLFSTFPFTHPDVGPWAWIVTLTDSDLDQNDIDFGNISSKPSTTTTIQAAATTILTGNSTTLTVMEQNNGNEALTGPYIDIFKDGLLFATESAPPDSGDAGTINTLDIGETWVWSGITTGSLTALSTNFTAIGHGLTTNGTDVTFDNGFAAELDSVIISAIDPHTSVTQFVSSNSTVYEEGDVTLTMSDYNDGNVALSFAHAHLLANEVTMLPPYDEMDHNSPFFTGNDTTNVGFFDPGETWTWVVTIPVSSNTTFRVIGHGTDPLGNAVDYPTFESETATLQVDAINPDTAITVSANATTVYFGTGTTLDVTEANPNTLLAVPLTDPRVEMTGGLVLTLNGTSPYFVALSDPADPGVLNPGKTWHWQNIPTGPLSSNTTFVATGHGIDSLGNDVTVPDHENEQDSVSVDVISPDTAVTISANATTVYFGTGTTLAVTEANPNTPLAAPLTSPRVELTGGLVLTLNGTSPYFVPSSDPADPGVLDPGETWQWHNIPTGPLSGNTAFVATGHGIDPLNNDVTVPDHENEQASVEVDVINPDTAVTISANLTAVLIHHGTTLDVTEANPNTPLAVPLTNPRVELTGGLVLTLNGTSPYFVALSDPADPGVLDPGETWHWQNIPTGLLSGDTTFIATGHGTDPLHNDVTVPAHENEQDSISVHVLNPNTRVTISADPPELFTDQGVVTLTVTEHNSGNVDLTNVYVDISGGANYHLTQVSYPPGTIFSGDGPAFNVLDAAAGGETWQWVIPNVPVMGNTIFTATGHGYFNAPPLIHITSPSYPDEEMSISVATHVPTAVPAVTDLGILILVGGLAALTGLMAYRRVRRV
jgi:hypothetical protein